MIARLLVRASLAFTAVAIALGVGAPVSAAPVDDTTPPLVPVPPGCPTPDPADVAFVGEVVDKDGFIEKGTVRFAIVQIRAGDASPYSAQGLIDVRYGPDSKYLDIGEQYFVGAAVDSATGQLASTLEADPLLFGGDAVIGVDDNELECPDLDDPVQTLNVDGTEVETGLLAPLFDDRRLLLATIGVPAAIVGAVLIALVLLRKLLDLGLAGVFHLGRSAVTPTSDHRAARVREHAPADPEREREPLVGGGWIGPAFRRGDTNPEGSGDVDRVDADDADDRDGAEPAEAHSS